MGGRYDAEPGCMGCASEMGPGEPLAGGVCGFGRVPRLGHGINGHAIGRREKPIASIGERFAFTV